jgi:hypothetical protein
MFVPDLTDTVFGELPNAAMVPCFVTSPIGVPGNGWSGKITSSGVAYARKRLPSEVEFVQRDGRIN